MSSRRPLRTGVNPCLRRTSHRRPSSHRKGPSGGLHQVHRVKVAGCPCFRASRDSFLCWSDDSKRSIEATVALSTRTLREIVKKAAEARWRRLNVLPELTTARCPHPVCHDVRSPYKRAEIACDVRASGTEPALRCHAGSVPVPLHSRCRPRWAPRRAATCRSALYIPTALVHRDAVHLFSARIDARGCDRPGLAVSEETTER